MGRVGVTRPQASGLSLRILLKISSSLVVKIHQIGTKVEIVAREGGFFYGFAEQNPAAFLGGGLKLPLRQVGVLFCFVAA